LINPSFSTYNTLAQADYPRQQWRTLLNLLDKLDLLEMHLQKIIEGSAARLFPDYNMEALLAHRLVAALQAGAREYPDGSLVAPNLFILVVHTSRGSLLRQNESFFDQLTINLESSADEAGMRFLSPPVIRFVDDAEMPLQQFRVTAQISLDQLARTTDVLVETNTTETNVPENAFLIVNGMQIFPLTHSVINIGRRSDNQMALDDPRVSRVHAQLRAIKGRFVIFDLDSTGGTFVNAQRINQAPLYPGDVISLAGYPLVYGQDSSRLGETQKFTPMGDAGL
jgi:hypothetical protein